MNAGIALRNPWKSRERVRLTDWRWSGFAAASQERRARDQGRKTKLSWNQVFLKKLDGDQEVEVGVLLLGESRGLRPGHQVPRAATVPEWL